MPKSALLLAALLTAPVPAIATPTADEQAVLAADQAWVDAENRQDRAAVDALLADGFVATFDDGVALDKAAFLKHVFEDQPPGAQALSDRHATVAGDTGVVVGTDTITGKAGGSAYTVVGRLTAVYVRQKGRWKALALHFVTRR